MKLITIFSLFGASASALDLWCWGTTPAVSDGDVKAAVATRGTDLGIPGGIHYSYRSNGKCGNLNTVLVTANIKQWEKPQSEVRLANGWVRCSVVRRCY